MTSIKEIVDARVEQTAVHPRMWGTARQVELMVFVLLDAEYAEKKGLFPGGVTSTQAVSRAWRESLRSIVESAIEESGAADRGFAITTVDDVMRRTGMPLGDVISAAASKTRKALSEQAATEVI